MKDISTCATDEEKKEYLAEVLTTCLSTGTTLQSGVRATIAAYRAEATSDDAIAWHVAAAVCTFKNKSEREIPIFTSMSQKLDYRKRVNNIINDVSRICRELLGKSIVNTKRSGGVYMYRPEAPKPKAPRTSPAATVSVAPECHKAHYDASKHIPIPRSILEINALAKSMGWDIVMAPSSPESWVKTAQSLGMTLADIGKAVVAEARKAGTAT